jgi:hypothetical protein
VSNQLSMIMARSGPAGLPRGGGIGHDGLQDFVDAHAGLGRAGNGVGRIDADHVLDF